MRRPTISLFVVSYAKDFPWLTPLTRSIAKHCAGFHEIVLAIPEQDADALPADIDMDVVTFQENGLSGFMSHQFQKCCADLFCTGNLITYVDSDCVFISPTTPATYLDEFDWAINLFSKYKATGTTEHGGWWPSPWKACTEKVLGEPVEYETMRRHGATIWRDSLRRFREHVFKVQGRPLEEFLRPLKRHMPNADSFSEFNAIGSFCKNHKEPGYRWIEAESDEAKTLPNNLHQFSGFHFRVIDPTVQAKLREFGLLDPQPLLL